MSDEAVFNDTIRIDEFLENRLLSWGSSDEF